MSSAIRSLKRSKKTGSIAVDKMTRALLKMDNDMNFLKGNSIILSIIIDLLIEKGIITNEELETKIRDKGGKSDF